MSNKHPDWMPDFIPGDGATIHGWTDKMACTVIARPSRARMILQRDRVEIVADRRTFIPGGFAAHCPNPSAVDYAYSPDPEGVTFVATLRKDGSWRLRGSTSRVTAGRREYYDVNF
jgi:hypothetical protein